MFRLKIFPLPLSLKAAFLYGMILAVVTLLLQWLEYQYLLRRYSVETYILVLCILFTAVGTWLGKHLGRPAQDKGFGVNTKALAALGISEREARVLELLGAGYNNAELADALNISVNTVKTHLKNLYSKLDVGQRGKAIRKARELRLIP